MFLLAMKDRRSILRISAIVFITFTIVSSCRKENKGSDYSYFLSKELSVSYTSESIIALLDFASNNTPELSSIKPLVISDVDVYKVVYRTTLNGSKIDASGLVCVPSTPGKYPVISFQNGTNTLNNNAPSESISDSYYRLIEIVASLGYVVVIADYPGFGESVQVPHPYLITEPTVTSLVDLLFAARELAGNDLPGIELKNEYYLLGYSQGGWATLALHKALELGYSTEFNLRGSACGSGPYNIYQFAGEMIDSASYAMPVFLGYLVNAYSAYNQFSNPVSEIFNEPYASRVPALYSGLLSSVEINNQLTTSIEALITSSFLSGFSSSPDFESVHEAFINNSISGWHSYIPLMFIHGGDDTYLDPVSTENIYTEMVQAGTSIDICKKVIVPGIGHADGIVPCMVKSVLFLYNLRIQN
jgi:pimeloyl-ACP methyl ester carboxylesterase